MASVGDPIDVWALGRNLPEYFEQPSACYAVALPFVLGVFFNLTRPAQKWPECHAAIFVLGTALSVVFSFHRISFDQESLLGLPGYALLLMLLPVRYAPSWQQAFACGFASTLIADLWGSAVPHLTHAALPADFYFGVGGAGFGDQLFLVPWITAVAVGLRSWLATRLWATQPVGLTLRALGRQLLRSTER